MSRRLRYSLLKHGRVACERCKACYNDFTKDGAFLSTKWTFVRVAYYESPRSQAQRAQTDWITFIQGGAQ